MTTQTGIITDIRRALVNGETFATVTITPSAPTNSPFPGAVQGTSPLTITGIPGADVADWNVGDTITGTFSK